MNSKLSPFDLRPHENIRFRYNGEIQEFGAPYDWAFFLVDPVAALETERGSRYPDDIHAMLMDVFSGSYEVSSHG